MNKALILLLLLAMANCAYQSSYGGGYGGGGHAHGKGAAQGHTHGDGASHPKRFYLEFEYACHNNLAFDSCTGTVLWNGQIIVLVHPQDYGIHRYSTDVEISIG